MVGLGLGDDLRPLAGLVVPILAVIIDPPHDPSPHGDRKTTASTTSLHELYRDLHDAGSSPNRQIAPVAWENNAGVKRTLRLTRDKLYSI